MDLDADGQIDMLSGSWPGELFLFKGGPDRSFAPAEMIRDKEGNFINIGGGMEERPDGNIMIIGKADFEQTEEGTFVNYHGKRLESTPEKPISVTGSASAVHAADWDGDGDHDLLVGSISGEVHLIPNEGTPTAYAFGKEKAIVAGGKPVKIGRTAGPHAADWDGDNDLDLLVGAGDGSVWLYTNTGTARSPELAKGVKIVSERDIGNPGDAAAEVRRGMRSRIWVADWNGDKRMDLLVGDFTSQKPDLPEPSPEVAAEHAKIREELEAIQKEYRELAQKLYGTARVTTQEDIDKVQKAMRDIYDKMGELTDKLPPEYENHGWIWLFLRTEPDKEE